MTIKVAAVELRRQRVQMPQVLAWGWLPQRKSASPTIVLLNSAILQVETGEPYVGLPSLTWRVGDLSTAINPTPSWRQSSSPCNSPPPSSHPPCPQKPFLHLVEALTTGGVWCWAQHCLGTGPTPEVGPLMVAQTCFMVHLQTSGDRIGPVPMALTPIGSGPHFLLRIVGFFRLFNAL